MAMSDVHQCHRCELRFRSRNELHDHFDQEHATFEDPLHTATPHRLTDDEIATALAELGEWRRNGDAIERELELPSFAEAIAFVNRVADAAEAADHHPDIDIRYRTVRLLLTSHDAKGLTRRDVKLARTIDSLA